MRNLITLTSNVEPTSDAWRARGWTIISVTTKAQRDINEDYEARMEAIDNDEERRDDQLTCDSDVIQMERDDYPDKAFDSEEKGGDA
jgi:hypothetical protein